MTSLHATNAQPSLPCCAHNQTERFCSAAPIFIILTLATPVPSETKTKTSPLSLFLHLIFYFMPLSFFLPFFPHFIWLTTWVQTQFWLHFRWASARFTRETPCGLGCNCTASKHIRNPREAHALTYHHDPYRALNWPCMLVFHIFWSIRRPTKPGAIWPISSLTPYGMETLTWTVMPFLGRR